MESHKAERLLMLIFQYLDNDLKEQFCEILDSFDLKLDWAINELMKEKIFPDWFNEVFYFEPLYRELNGLRDSLSRAHFNLLLGMDCTNFKYRIDPYSNALKNTLLKRVSMDEKSVKDIAEKLSKKLKEKMLVAS